MDKKYKLELTLKTYVCLVRRNEVFYNKVYAYFFILNKLVSVILKNGMKVMINCTNDTVTAKTTCELEISTETKIQEEPIDELQDRVIPSITQSQRPTDSGKVLFEPNNLSQKARSHANKT